MPTTDVRLAAAALDALVAAGVPFAVLHREGDIASGDVGSDIDVILDGFASRALRVAGDALWARGIRLLVVCPYDRGAVATFWADPFCTAGMQLDFLTHPAGGDRCGLRSSVVVAAAVQGRRWPRLSPLDELVYLLRKRQVKGDAVRFAELAAQARSVGLDAVCDRARQVLHPAAARRLEAALRNGSVPPTTANPLRPGRLRWRPGDARRYAGRIRRPVGFWAHLTGAAEPVASKITGRFRRVLVAADVIPLTAGPSGWWVWARRVMPLRLRPALAVTVGRVPTGMRPDLVADEGDTDAVADAITAAMHRRSEGALGWC